MVKTTESFQYSPQGAAHLAVLSVFHLFRCSQNSYLYCLWLHHLYIQYSWVTGLPVRSARKEAPVTFSIYIQLPDDGIDGRAS